MSEETEIAVLRRENQRLRNRCEKLEHRYRTTLDSISEIYFETDRQGQLTFFNESFTRLTGFSRKALLGKTAKDLCPRESARNLEALFRQILEKKAVQELSHVEILHLQGHALPLEVSVSPIRDTDQHLQGFRGVARDISMKIQAEREKAVFTEQMQQAQKLEAIGTLAAGIAHNFNNLLMAIQGNVSLILLHAEPGTPMVTRLMKIEDQVRQGAALTRQLLGFSEDQAFSPQVCNLNTLVEDTLLFFSRTCKHLHLHRDLDPELKPVMADPAQIRQVLLNICINGSEHAMPQGGRLYVETANVSLSDPFVQPHRLPAGDYVRIRIRDTGMGMEEETRRRVFDPFFTTQEKGRATGLGLASAFSVIKNHQGILSVHSTPGEGCTFAIHLPCVENPGASKAPPSRKLSILVVDDEEIIREVAADLLEELGHRPVCVPGGREALNLLDTSPQPIDLVILDMIMPGMDGHAVLAALRERSPRLPVLISTGFGPQDLDDDNRTSGCTGFIQKPFTLEKLDSALRRLSR